MTRILDIAQDVAALAAVLAFLAFINCGSVGLAALVAAWRIAP